ncbi:hypothetical protein BUALT_Bualt05G0068800 [Buddleja alternifolia]|uniref:Uncharacterized protein n=1 Tax=Buddleja alternifolia TaxID=168488 RepID=A0AAV6XH91_9LAMI|nr:hypothetical protein BUALT_Bualt05G0068800 [Buddleja alternifolia]
MASSCYTCLSSLHLSTSVHKNGIECSSLGRSNLQFLQKCPQLRSERRRTSKGSNKDFVVRNATPEIAGDVVSSFSGLGIPGLSMLGDNPWLTGIAGLMVTVPFLIQRLIAFTKEVDVAAQTIEKIADTVGKVAEEVDKAAEDMAEALPEGGLKKVVSFVEDLAEETVKDAQMVEDLMDKVEKLDDKLEEFLKKQPKGTEKA